jgi:hypothetical protein
MWRISWSNSIIRWQDYRVAALRPAESNFRHTQDSPPEWSVVPVVFVFLLDVDLNRVIRL